MKKFILFIVEGKNDEREIGAMLHTPFFSKYLEKYEPYFLTKGGDITSSFGIKANNIQQKLNELVLFFRRNGVPYTNIKVQDIQEVVQIVDLDGAFIPGDRIIRSDDSKFQYSENAIYTSNVDGAIGRNRKKAEILSRLVEIEQIGNIPYSAYFVSCNMDHLLFNQQLEAKDKSMCCLKFQEECKKKPNCLNESVFKMGIMASGSYLESWEKVKEDCESLHRHTNFNLFFGDEAKNPK